MSTFSAQPGCLTTLTSSNLSDYSSDTITLSGSTATTSWCSGNTITLTSTSTGSSYTYSTAGINCHTSGISGISTIDISSIWNRQDFVDCMPELKRIEEMCKEYPGLKIAFEKFKTTYFLVKDHYDTPEDQRPRP